MLAAGPNPHNRVEVIIYNQCVGDKVGLLND